MHKAHKIRLNPTPEQRTAFMRAAGVARFAFNWALTEYQRLKEAGLPVDWNALKVVETQAPLRRAEAKLKRLQRGLARKKKGSKNRARWKQRVGRQHERVRNRRSDFCHKFTAGLVARFGTVCVEDLNLGGLCRTRLAKSFHDAGIGEALRQLDYKLTWSGGSLIRVGRFFPSSKRCHACSDRGPHSMPPLHRMGCSTCGAVYAGLALQERSWRCERCGTQHDRDLNAAINLEVEGLSLLAGNGSLGGTPVEPSASTAGFGPKQAGATKQELDGAHLCPPER